MSLDLTQHPCFNPEVRGTNGRIHLPVAPRCNIQCNYCDRKFDCLNESRPGVTSTLLKPSQALAYLDRALQCAPRLRVVGIAGPGDPFASPEETLETLWLVRQKYPEMLLCVASNGLNVEPYVEQLAKLEVSHVTITVNAVDPVIGAQIYAWVRDGRTIYRGEDGARHLLQRQLSAIAALKKTRITVKVNTILVPGLNDDHAPEVAEALRELGVDIMNCVPLYPVKGTKFAEIPEMEAEKVQSIRRRLSGCLPQMEHCTRCRADAVGLLGEMQTAELVGILHAAANGTPDGHSTRPYVAVATMEGILINQHLGEAARLWILQHAEAEPKLIELRETPPPGGGNERWRQLADSLDDCHAILVSGIGRAPRWVLESRGLRVIEASGLISEAIESLHSCGDLPASMKQQFRSCGSGCQGTHLGCG